MKKVSAPVSSSPINANIAPGKKVFVNCNLLIKHAIIKTPAAIVKGTGKLDGEVRVCTVKSLQ